MSLIKASNRDATLSSLPIQTRSYRSFRSTIWTISAFQHVSVLMGLSLQQRNSQSLLYHTRYTFQSNTIIYYTKLSSRQHVSTLISHHQAIQRTNPRYIIYQSAFWDSKSLQWVVKLIEIVWTYELDKHIGMTTVKLLACHARSINLYKNLRSKLLKCCGNIYFNKQCLNKKVVPKYACVKIANTSSASHVTVKKVCTITINLMFTGPCIIVITEE